MSQIEAWRALAEYVGLGPTIFNQQRDNEVIISAC